MFLLITGSLQWLIVIPILWVGFHPSYTANNRGFGYFSNGVMILLITGRGPTLPGGGLESFEAFLAPNALHLRQGA